MRNFLRFTSLLILLAACGCGASRAAIDRRYHSGVETTMQVLGEWLAPFPGEATVAEAPAMPRFLVAASMTPETAGSRAASRLYFERLVDLKALPPAFADALVEYASRRAVSKIVDRQYFTVARGRVDARYFGGRLPRDLHLQIPVEAGANRALLTLYTLERWVGRPVFDSILAEFVKGAAGAHASLDDFIALASRVSGQDMRWLFDEALDKHGRFDYAVETFDSEADARGFHTTVTVRRLGDALVSRAIPVATTFADGEVVHERFDGRQTTMTYEYRSQARATSAEIDPEHVLLLDGNRGNNGMSIDNAAARTAANRWTARWMIWLEDALLTYVALT